MVFMNSVSPRYFYLLALVGSLLFSLSCRKKDKIDPDPSLTLSFSTDTVFFDTVFTTVGSVTQRLIVYNPNNRKILVSSIRLEGGTSSNYRINVDGTPELTVSDIEIPANDSIFVFIRATVDPNNQNTPFIVSDSIAFLTNGNLQMVKLVAYGQNAYFYRNANLEGNIIWDSLKAHVIYGSLRIDTASSLIIMPGTKIYFHKDSYLAVSTQSTLSVLGTLDHPVRFQGDRMDPFYKDLPGQWDGIYLENGSKDHEFNYALIKNGMTGLVLDSLSSSGSPMLILNNTIIQNMLWDGIFAYATSIQSTNCVIGNCGGAALDIIYGGSYDFRQLTVGNFWTSSVRTSPSIFLSNYTYDTLGNKISNGLVKSYFGNCILYGAAENEIQLDSVITAPFIYTFDHCLLKTNLKTSDPTRFLECIVNQDPLFLEVQKWDYQIDSLSPAIDRGVPMGVTWDIKGVDRGDTPDLGAYEYVKREGN